MNTLWTEFRILGHMYAEAATHFAWAFVASVFIAALLTSSRLDRRMVPWLEQAGTWGYTGALLLGLVSPL